MAGTIYPTFYGWHHISDILWQAPYIRHFMAGTIYQAFYGWHHISDILWLAPSTRHFMAGTIYQTFYGWHHLPDILWLAPYIRHFMAGTIYPTFYGWHVTAIAPHVRPANLYKCRPSRNLLSHNPTACTQPQEHLDHLLDAVHRAQHVHPAVRYHDPCPSRLLDVLLRPTLCKRE